MLPLDKLQLSKTHIKFQNWASCTWFHGRLFQWKGKACTWSNRQALPFSYQIHKKQSKIGKNSKVNHLSYVGDAILGKNINIGAGTITCNYDGVKKNKTIIKDKVFIGSNTSLVAPITIEEQSVVGAGSVITRKVNKKSLAITRANQIEVKNYKRKK